MTFEAFRLFLISSLAFGGAGLLLYALAGPLVLLYATSSDRYRPGYCPSKGYGPSRDRLFMHGGNNGVDIANLGIVATTNVVFDILLIPDYGALGCALSTLTAELVFLFACSRSAYPVARKSSQARKAP